MDTPGYDPVSATGIVAGGANIMCFTTGRGSVYGCKPAPTIKLATNCELYRRMRDDMDVDCGPVSTAGRAWPRWATALSTVIGVASGDRRKSEELGLRRQGVRAMAARSGDVSARRPARLCDAARPSPPSCPCPPGAPRAQRRRRRAPGDRSLPPRSPGRLHRGRRPRHGRARLGDLRRHAAVGVRPTNSARRTGCTGSCRSAPAPGVAADHRDRPRGARRRRRQADGVLERHRRPRPSRWSP